MNNILNENLSKILNYQLAFESYIDNTNDNIPLLNETYIDIKYLRENKNIINENELIILSNKILNNFKELLDIVGKDKFIFYEDNQIEYDWDSYIKGGNNRKKKR